MMNPNPLYDQWAHQLFENMKNLTHGENGETNY